MQVIIEHDTIVEAVREYMWRKYGMVVSAESPVNSMSIIERIWAVEAPFAKNQPRPNDQQFRSAAEALNARASGDPLQGTDHSFTPAS